MSVFVQNNRVVKNTGAVATAARALDIEIIDISFPWVEAPALPEHDVVLVYGSVAFVRALRALSPSWARHICWTPQAFMASEWSARYGEHYLGHAGRRMASGEVAAALPAAVRPLHGDKSFNGGVYSAATWQPPAVETQAWVAPIKEILREVRVWIVRGDAICAAQYKPDVALMELGELDGAIAQLAPFPLPDIVVDLALTPDGWKLLEFNCINTAGLYAVDARLIVAAFHGRRLSGE